VRGLTLYPGDQPFFPLGLKWTPAFEFAAEHKIPVMIRGGDTSTPKGKLKHSHPLNVVEVAVELPDVKRRNGSW
jgi:predicted TIM-barrel fold metal-dependent hydrolase